MTEPKDTAGLAPVFLSKRLAAYQLRLDRISHRLTVLAFITGAGLGVLLAMFTAM